MTQQSTSAIRLDPSPQRLEELAFAHGQAYDSYLSTEGDLHQFWSANGTGVIAYARISRFVHAQGGLLAPPEERQQLLKEFFEFVEQNRFVATFYNIGEAELPLFEQQGFQITKWGEEPLLDVPELTWSGHTYEWVRRQSNYCRRQKTVVTECRPGDHSFVEWSCLMEEIQAIASDCLSSKPQRSDIRFFNGSVAPQNWDRRRLFVARSEGGSGRIEGFLICLPYDQGRQWAIDTYRHRSDAPRGVVPYLIHEAVNHLQSEDVKSVSLCLCPAVGYERLKKDSWVIRRCLQFGFKYASAFFDMPGEYHFKSRFRPRFVKRYICHWPQATIGSMSSTITLSSALNLDLKKLGRNLWSRVAVPQKRKNLALPTTREAVAATKTVRPHSRLEKQTATVSQR